MFPILNPSKPYVYPLSLFGNTPLIAVSTTRKLISTYSGDCILVRRGSDNAQLAIGYIGASMDTAALLNFIGGSDGYIVTKYDNSSNGQDATENTAARQPIIVQNGELITVNGLPCEYYQPSPNTSLTTVNAVNWGATARTSFIIKKLVDVSVPIWPLTGNDGSGNQSYYEDIPDIYGVARQGLETVVNATVTNSLEMELITLRYGTTTKYQELFRNSILIGTGTATVNYPNITDKIVFGCYPGFAPNFYMAEFIAFDSVISNAEKTAYENNTMSFYRI